MPHWYNREEDSERRTNLDNWRTPTVILSKIRGWLKRSWAFCDRKDIGQVSIKLSSDRCQSWNETGCISKRMTICIDVCFRMMRRSGQTTTKVRKKRRCTYTRSHFRWTLFVAFSLFAAAVVPFASTCISLIFWLKPCCAQLEIRCIIRWIVSLQIYASEREGSFSLPKSCAHCNRKMLC